ncbi:hypothetical protein Afil01_66110 [Actinorhabdospora filicis]|uniref:DUF3558 domain-containing protein n=1 Tax=Actinorhabdospora filicis TaxID=1785913 RepID=A0A9W6STR4_9ACTN|nr:hypothetical protein [Actinorhabdospora filicis]GLZ81804.1 hypothetical protein Afil01_66110 [Actinorhabdospora filicis]
MNDEVTRRPSTALGLVTRLVVLAAVVAVILAGVVVVWRAADPPVPPDCSALPQDLGAAVGIQGPAPVFYVDDEENARHCEWHVSGVTGRVSVTVFARDFWDAPARLTELRQDVEKEVAVSPGDFGEGSFTAERASYGDHSGVVGFRAGDLVVLVEVYDKQPTTSDAVTRAAEAARRVRVAL